MRLAHFAAGLSLILLAACSGGGQNPSVSVASAPSSATADCAGPDSRYSGDVGYLNCVEHE
jgi:hypothetical protein